MIHILSKTVAAAGAREPLSATREPANWITVQAKGTNNGTIYLGDLTVAPGLGIELMKWDSQFFPPISDTIRYDLKDVYVDASLNGEGVNVIWGR